MSGAAVVPLHHSQRYQTPEKGSKFVYNFLRERKKRCLEDFIQNMLQALPFFNLACKIRLKTTASIILCLFHRKLQGFSTQCNLQLGLTSCWKFINNLLICKTAVHVICASSCIVFPEKYAAIQDTFRKRMCSETEAAKHPQLLPFRELTEALSVQQHP